MDDSFSLRGNVEGCCSGLGLHPDGLLLAVGYSSPKCMDLAMYILGWFAKGLVPGATVRIRLLWPSRFPCVDVLAC